MVDDLEAQGANGGGGPLGAPSAGGAEGDVGLQPPGGVAQLRHRVVVVGAAVVAVGDVQWGCVLLWEGGVGGGEGRGKNLSENSRILIFSASCGVGWRKVKV